MEITLKEQYDYLFKMEWSWDDRFYAIFLTPEESKKCSEYQSNLRRAKYVDSHTLSIIRSIIRLGENKYSEFQEKLRNQPRRDAQKFIGNKKTRDYIFSNYGKVCMCCGSTVDITIDHIIPVYKNGANKLDNLQPLCRGCNTRKGTNIIDYR